MKQDSQAFDIRNFRFGGFWRRVVAGIADWTAIILVYGQLFGFENMSTFSEATSSKNTNVPTLLLMYVLYFSVMECTRLQATFGKLAMGLKVTDRNGGRITFLRSIGRNFSKLASFLMLYVGFLMIAVNRKKLGLHDVFCGTQVVSRGWHIRRNASKKTRRQKFEEAKQDEFDAEEWKKFEGLSNVQLIYRSLDSNLDNESRDSLNRYLKKQDLDLRRELDKIINEMQFEYRGPDKMTQKDAYDILDLSQGATEKEIIDAYKKYISLLHPDRGGTDLLAAFINNAKDLLLRLQV